MTDPTETIRRQRLAEINAEPGSREALEALYGTVWTIDELAEEFEVIGFMAPLVVVRRKADGVKGSLKKGSPDSAQVEAFVSEIRNAPWTQVETVGEGQEFRAEFGGKIGSALLLNGALVHGSVVAAM